MAKKAEDVQRQQEDVQEEAAQVVLGERPVEDASAAVREELAAPQGIQEAREEAARPTLPHPHDGTNTGQTNPQPGPRPGVTLAETEGDPTVPGNADTALAQRARAQERG